MYLYLDNIKIYYFVENINTIIKYGKIIKKIFDDKEVNCNIYNHNKNQSITFFIKIINDIDSRAINLIKVHELCNIKKKY